MDRLTEKTIGCFEYDLKNHKHVVGEFGTYDTFYNYSTAVKRLGQYEDTGFTPEEINSLRSYMGAIQDDHLEQESRIECKQLELDSLRAQLADTQARLAEAVGKASRLIRAMMCDENVIPCDWCSTPTSDETLEDCEGCSQYTENENDECRFNLDTATPAAKAGERMMAMLAYEEVAADD